MAPEVIKTTVGHDFVSMLIDFHHFLVGEMKWWNSDGKTTLNKSRTWVGISKWFHAMWRSCPTELVFAVHFLKNCVEVIVFGLPHVVKLL